MIHQPLGGTEGQASDIAIHAEHILKTKDILYDIITKCTGQDKKQVITDCDRDNFLSADKAKKYGKLGIVDKIIEKRI